MKQRPKGAASPQASSQFLFLLFLGDDLRLLPWALRSLGCGLRLDASRPWLRLALLKIFHKFFHQQVGQFFPQLFQLLFQQVFRLLLLQVFFAVLPVTFATIFAKTSLNPAPTISPVSGSLSLLSISIFSLYNNCQGDVYVIQIYFAIFVISKPKSDFRDCFCVNFTPQIIIGLNFKGHRSCLC